jgi:hypothetical protein
LGSSQFGNSGDLWDPPKLEEQLRSLKSAQLEEQLRALGSAKLEKQLKSLGSAKLKE